ncbi:MAG: AraC family transcriptional regulator [Clostridiales bacterium]|nr:AraC family transcriptional regulator [Clostridiales bacterium]
MHNPDAVHQQIEYDDSRFPIRYVKLECHPADNMFSILQWHEDIEFKVVRRGRMCVSLNGREIKLNEGDILAVNPYETHRNTDFFSETCYELIIFNVRLLLGKMSCFFDRDVFLKLLNGSIKINNVIRDPKIARVFDMLIEEMQSPQNEMPAVCLSLYLLSVLLKEQACEVPSGSALRNDENLKRLEPVTQYIKKHLCENLSLKVLADVGGFSPKYLSSLFKNTVNINLQEYIMQLRLSRAQELLSMTDNKISSIALELGFEYENYFIKWFKKRTGVTPSRYRAMKR